MYLWADQHESRSSRKRPSTQTAQSTGVEPPSLDGRVDHGLWTQPNGLMASQCAGSLEEAERLVGHGTDLLKRFNITLQAARERVYYGLKASATLPETVSAEKEEAMQREADSTEGLRKRRRSRVETLMRCSVER